jgi:hypothetical protein
MPTLPDNLDLLAAVYHAHLHRPGGRKWAKSIMHRETGDGSATALDQTLEYIRTHPQAAEIMRLAEKLNGTPNRRTP